MTLIDTLYAQGLRALREPRAAAADVIALDLPKEAFAPALLLVVVVSVIINSVAEFIAPSPLGAITHFQMTVFLTLLIVGFAVAVCKIGQLMGGIGRCTDSVMLAIFFQAVFLPAQVFQVIVMALSPLLSAFLALFLFVFGIWVNTNFIAALHGYAGFGKAFAVLILASIAVALLMAIAAQVIGISLFGTLPNV